MIVKATAKSVRMSPRKVGVVAALVRERSAGDALVILEHTPRRAAAAVKEVVKSAVANAENNHKLNKEKLLVKAVEVGPSRTLKRVHLASRGRMHRINKRTSNITVLLSDEMPKPETVAKQPAKPKAKPKTNKKAEVM